MTSTARYSIMKCQLDGEETGEQESSLRLSEYLSTRLFAKFFWTVRYFCNFVSATGRAQNELKDVLLGTYSAAEWYT